jgi:hypothetical protein
MKRAILISVMLLAGVSSAQADDSEMNYRDLIRPQGHPRSDAIYTQNLDLCYNQTGIDRKLADTPAFKKCMLSRGYRWQFTRMVRTSPEPTPPEASSAPYSSPAYDWTSVDSSNTAIQQMLDTNAMNAANASAAQQTMNNASFNRQ